MSEEVAVLVAKHFVARSDVKAIQHADGTWAPIRQKWSKQDFVDHVTKVKTFGHYMLDKDDTCKLFAFDIDLVDSDQRNAPMGSFPTSYNTNANYEDATEPESLGLADVNPRTAWADRGHVARPFLKYQLKTVAAAMMRAIHNELSIPTLAAYSGSKGVHVYGFTGRTKADEVREAADLVLDAMGCWELARGTSIFRHIDDPDRSMQNFTVEVFPKQRSLDSKDLGNLMRLPLGRNLKNPKDPCFFIDFTSPMSTMKPLDPAVALTAMNPWASAA